MLWRETMVQYIHPMAVNNNLDGSIATYLQIHHTINICMIMGYKYRIKNIRNRIIDLS